MKQPLLILSFLLTTAMCLADNKLLVPQHSVDSILILIDKSPDNEEKVRLLNEYARMCFYNQEYKKGLDAAIESREISDDINFEGGYVEYYITLASFVGRSAIYQYLLSRANELAAEIQREDLFEEPTYPIGYPYPQDSELLAKMSTLKSEFLEKGEKEISAYIIGVMGWCNFNIREYAKVDDLSKEAIKIYRDLNLFIPLLTYYQYQIRLSGYLGYRDRNKIIRAQLDSLATSYDIYSKISDYERARLYLILEKPSLAIKYYSKSLRHHRSVNNTKIVSNLYSQLDNLYGTVRNYSKQAETCESWIQYLKEVNLVQDLETAYHNLYNAYLRTEEYDKFLQVADSALYYSSNKDLVVGKIQHMRGQQALVEGSYAEALKIFEERSRYSQATGYSTYVIPFDLAKVHLKLEDYEKAEEYISLALNHSYGSRYNFHGMQSLLLAYEIYKNLGRYDKALEYLKDYQERRDELVQSDYDTKMSEALLEAEIEAKQQEIQKLEKEQFIKEQQTKIQRFWIVSISGALISAIIIAFVLYRNNQNKQRANAKLKEQKEEIESTLEKLESTQTQLIHSEKMASLGELTAGIAHEIQNPLNFVNNFSELNRELIEELKDAVSSNNQEEIQEILKDLAENEDKVKHHGQRAEGIVKGMLMHSRTSHGEQEPTDINALADEYLRLAYHGLRAKDKTFNADFKTDFDPNLPKINVVPQDIGRVLLNLINNGFYACAERSLSTVHKMTARHSDPEHSEWEESYKYQPQVTVCTKATPLPGGAGGGFKEVQITVSDNGPGIPEKVKEKIFQPFFTTKPTGQGTGLGLSLSYDIVKAHGGEIIFRSINREENEVGTEFIITLPANS